ncbi:MarR family winged helix-turn-helix transcriptional regulator [Nocardia sp. alder85J]|uniref:MarR family winged helix-turn-helix transcriptional regulator n=1 Tax=Nocardia sp. alder85J TaxID=2862949 RepID=UPI001CD5F54F|nr:MarR family transcriptional regulator [Nocardia sp. alder85J]MCX4091521.1 MarR family transcriptional regulator [Nocardia sp. alder85J]
MAEQVDVEELAVALRASVGLLARRLREAPSAGELSLSERSALSRLERGGPVTPSALAKLERVSPQSMGATVRALEERGLVERRADPGDGRRVLLSVTDGARELVGQRRTERAALLARALDAGLDRGELELLAAAVPLIEKVAERI